MKVATFNINNINKRLANLLEWLGEAQPDVVCLQELKAQDDDFPEDAIGAAGYHAAWRGQRSWNGVAILSRGAVPVVTRKELPGSADDGQARYLEAAVAGVLIGCLYAPNGNPQPGPKFDYKLAWMARLEAHAQALLAARVPVILAGDYNVVPEARDIYETPSYRDNALVQPAPRAAYRRLLDQGWTDAIRTAFPDEPAFTFWDYQRNRWERNAGLRLDHLLVSPDLLPDMTAAGIDRPVRGRNNASDHAPAWIELGGAPVRKPKTRRRKA